MGVLIVPEEFEEEGRRLMQEFFSQGSDDDTVEYEDIDAYVREHATKEFNAWRDETDAFLEAQAAKGIRY